MFSDYNSLEEAYNFFNEKLFEGKLEPVIITLVRKKGSLGFFRLKSFTAKGREDKASELALNPDGLDRTDLEILSTLVHEMCHKAQYQYGNPSRPGYHNKEWGAMMESLGLMPSSTGMEGGKRTGQKMTHYIIPGGRFEILALKYIEDGFKLNWAGITAGLAGLLKPAAKKAKSKVKYTCPECKLNAWAKPEAPLMCGICRVDMESEDIDDGD